MNWSERHSQIQGIAEESINLIHKLIRYGNTFSHCLGTFVGTFCGMMIADVFDIGEGSLWANAFGIFVGGLLGIAIQNV